MPKITADEVSALRAAGRVVIIYPRKGLAVVDGFKRYKIAAPDLVALGY